MIVDGVKLKVEFELDFLVGNLLEKLYFDKFYDVFGSYYCRDEEIFKIIIIDLFCISLLVK